MSGLQPIKGSGWLWFLGVAMIILAVIWVLNKNQQREAMKAAAIAQSQPKPAVIEKTCPEDPNKCPVCEGAKNVYIALNKKEIRAKGFSEIEIKASPGCWSGYAIITEKDFGWAESFPSGPVIRDDIISSKEREFFEENQTSPSIFRGNRPNGVQWRFLAKEKPEIVKIRIASKREKLYENMNK